MIALVAILIGVLLLLSVVYEWSRLITVEESRLPPLARLRGNRAALEAAEQWCVGLRLHGRIDTAAHQRRMSDLAHGRRIPAHQ